MTVRAALAIGDTGPAGGIVFYITQGSGGLHGLEAAPVDQSMGAPWCTDITDLPGTNTAVGTGAANTAAILAACNDDDNAASLATAYGLGGYSDWFLPSKDELHLMYTVLHLNNMGGFASIDYWSSSQDFSVIAWFQGFSDGFQGNDYKGDALGVRAVRAF